ncbi:MAG: 4-hydroxybenzoate octaprenyltransferase [Phycisphaerae bacterium]|nr:4-hydroxybenzoate octaprenyltransferase [Phycisphaerae bacterium]
MNLQKTIHTWGEMIKFGHSIFALPFALMATFLAGRQLPGKYPSLRQFVLIVICMVSARSLAMTFNRIVDARIDANNPRTAGRALPAGMITMRQAWTFFLLCSLMFLVGTAGFLRLTGNPWPLLLALPVMVYLCGYSYAKRFTRWSHFWLGSAIALSPAAAWLAIHPASIGLSALLLVLAVTFWIGGFDIIYACQDIEFDRSIGLHSLPSRLGPAAALWIARTAHTLVVVLLAGLGIIEQLGMAYWIGVGGVALLLFIENSLVHPHDFSRVNLAFFTINGVVSLLLGTLTIVDIIL